MSKKEDEPVVEEPQVEDDEAEESDEYDVEVRARVAPEVGGC